MSESEKTIRYLDDIGFGAYLRMESTLGTIIQQEVYYPYQKMRLCKTPAQRERLIKLAEQRAKRKIISTFVIVEKWEAEHGKISSS